MAEYLKNEIVVREINQVSYAKISVLMGVYNCEKTLEEAVYCIINQTYTNWQLIICDDGSSDNTYQIAKSLEKNDHRILVIKNDRNLGLSATLNNCLKHAAGEFIARMDGDDVCDIKRFQLEINCFDTMPDIAVVSTAMNFYDENGIYGYLIYPEHPQPRDLFASTPFCHAACMIKTDVLEKLHGYRNVAEVERIEDYDLWLRLYEAGYKGYNIPECLYSMRDDRAALKRKKFRYRINEFKLKKRICVSFRLPLIFRIMAYKPIILGLLPSIIYKLLHRYRLSGKTITLLGNSLKNYHNTI